MSPAKLKPAELKALRAGLVDAAEAAGAVLMRWFRKPLKIREKLGAGLVTNADLASEAAVLRKLRRARPDFDILSEESAPDAKASSKGGLWIIDPLDGTTNFVHGFPMFCVSLAAQWEGRVVAGVIHHPVLGETYAATLGGGAWLGKTRLAVSRTATLSDSLLTTGFSAARNETLRAEMAPFERLSGVARAVRRPGSAALDLAYVSRGVFDGFWERRLSAWDVAAGALLVEEAGGRVTGFGGGPFGLHSGEVLASNSRLHARLVEQFREVPAL